MTSTRNLYEEALESLVTRLKGDRTILAAILFGSLAYDEVWDKSDIDVYLISEDDKHAPRGGFCLLENGINIHAQVMTRSKFKSRLEGDLQGSFLHSSFARSRLLFSRDESIDRCYENVNHVGARDRELQLLSAGSAVLPALYKAEKWFWVKKDLEYSFVWILFCVDRLATIEVLSRAEVPGREVIQQAMNHNAAFFKAVYTDLIHGPKTEETIRQALELINQYLDERMDLLFKPILDYLAEAGGTRSTTELDAYFTKIQAGGLSTSYEWLADKGVLQKVPVPLRLGEKSRVTVNEAAYYYDGGDGP
ncbi:MAG: nucleotidyltransferase domain-containing protein [Chloroflexi bacterium]|nr:nucleotidyltransferase domain-containing protein [Chloroflexota bacterium]